MSKADTSVRAPDATATYLAAEIPRQFTILGQRLLPFSLWHMELLTRLENGFLSAHAIDEGDLIQGIFFCCQTWEEGIAALRDWEGTEAKLAAWGQSVGGEIFRVEGGRVRSSLEEKAYAFLEYLQEGCGEQSHPRLVPQDGEDSRSPGAPLPQLLKLFLIRDLHLSLSHAMNYPFALACHDFFAFHEQNGSAKIANSDEAAALAEHDAAAESDEALKACLEALPGAVPISQADREKVKGWRKARGRRPKRKGKR